jgi:hypothetical protein
MQYSQSKGVFVVVKRVKMIKLKTLIFSTNYRQSSRTDPFTKRHRRTSSRQ